MNTLKPLADNLWVIDSLFTNWGLKGSTRSTVIRLPDGRLLIHSPVAMSPALHEELRQLGPTAFVLAPNSMHYMYLEEFLRAHPAAIAFISHALAAKHARFQQYQPLTNLTPHLPPELQLLPFKGHRIGESLLLHTPSQTLITADLFYNLQEESLPFEKTIMRLIGAYGKTCVPLYHRIAILNRTALRKSVDDIQQHMFQRIIMAHGRILESPEAPKIFHQAWKWL